MSPPSITGLYLFVREVVATKMRGNCLWREQKHKIGNRASTSFNDLVEAPYHLSFRALLYALHTSTFTGPYDLQVLLQ